MSALGQKRTLRLVGLMSPLPPKADIHLTSENVSKQPSLYHLRQEVSGRTMDKRNSVFSSVRLLTVVSVAFCLIPAGAHFFELANKMSLSTAEYMTAQKIYVGWSFFGLAITAAIVLTLTHTLMVRAERTAFLLSLAALVCLG